MTLPDVIPSPYFIRKLTRDLADELVGTLGPADPPAPTGWDRLHAGAAQMGVAIGELFGLALQKKSSTTPRGKLAHPHLAGTFLIIQRGGQIELHRNAGAAKVDSSATVYIVADLTGMPIARITGTVGASDFSAVQEPGLSTAGKYAIDLWLDPGQGGGDARLVSRTAIVLGGSSRL